MSRGGNVAAVIGGLLSSYGALNIAKGAPNCGQGGSAYCAGVFLPAAIGVPMLAWGLATWIGSRSAASNTSPRSTTVPDAPSSSPFDVTPATNGGASSFPE